MSSIYTWIVEGWDGAHEDVRYCLSEREAFETIKMMLDREERVTVIKHEIELEENEPLYIQKTMKE